jgi:hypothetical protein
VGSLVPMARGVSIATGKLEVMDSVVDGIVKVGKRREVGWAAGRLYLFVGW